MAILTGQHAEVKFDTANNDKQVTGLTGWNITANRSIHEVTEATATWRQFRKGITAWTATAEVNVPTTGLVPNITSDFGDDQIFAGTDVVCEFYIDENNVGVFLLYGNGVYNGMTLNNPVEGVTTATLEFTGFGSLTFATTAP